MSVQGAGGQAGKRASTNTVEDARELCDAVRQAYVFLTDALEEADLTEDEMHSAHGTFWVRLLCARERLNHARVSAEFAERANQQWTPRG